jgi:hypothetical protein
MADTGALSLTIKHNRQRLLIFNFCWAYGPKSQNFTPGALADRQPRK